MAKELAKAIFGKETSLVKLDMTEFTEPHSVSKLIGSPPGYVGFHEIDLFVDKVRRKPYCIVLLDELEKAHPNVIKLFLQVMADGYMTDSVGDKVDFKNVILIMTGNFGMNEKEKSSLGFAEGKDKKSEQNRLVNYCKARHGEEFLNRIDEFVPFVPLDDDSLRKVVDLQLEEIRQRISKRDCKLIFTDTVFDLLLKKSKTEYGKNANILERLITKEIEPCIADALLSLSKGLCTITVDTKGDKFVYKKKTKAKKSTKSKTSKTSKKPRAPKVSKMYAPEN